MESVRRAVDDRMEVVPWRQGIGEKRGDTTSGREEWMRVGGLAEVREVEECYYCANHVYRGDQVVKLSVGPMTHHIERESLGGKTDCDRKAETICWSNGA